MGLLAEGESLYSASNLNLLHHVTAAIRAHYLYQRNVHYIIHEGEVIIVDENTGRTMPGRRWSEGLHQAVEEKKVWKSSRKTRPLQLLHSRTISVCIKIIRYDRYCRY